MSAASAGVPDHFALLFEETHQEGVDWNDLVFLVERISDAAGPDGSAAAREKNANGPLADSEAGQGGDMMIHSGDNPYKITD